MKAERLKKFFLILILLNLCFLFVRSVLSYFLVTLTPFGETQSNEQQFFFNLSQKFAFLGEKFQNLLIGNSFFRNETIFVLSTVLPPLLSTFVFLLALTILLRHRRELSENFPNLIYYGSFGFIIVSALAIPVLAQDFWLSIAWGRMAASGVNPYHADLTLNFAQNLPLDALSQRMTYGPLWALISGILVWGTEKSTLLSAIIFKAFLVGASLGSISLVRKMLAQSSLFQQSLGLLIFGWMPLCLIDINAEGHNDIVMVFLLLLWLYLLEKGKITAASLALAASFLIKYTTAPLFLLEILYLHYFLKKPLKEYFLPLLYAGMLIIAVFAVFYRSPDFFQATSAMRDWHFFTPPDAVSTLVGFLSGPKWLRYLPILLFLLTSAFYIFQFTKDPSSETFRLAVLAVMSAILYCALGHIWSWFLVWVIPLSALLPRAAISIWNIVLAILFPAVILVLNLPPVSKFVKWQLTGMMIYIIAALLLIVFRHKFYWKKQFAILPNN